jgi:4'-phosphopantetheinyl transferase
VPSGVDDRIDSAFAQAGNDFGAAAFRVPMSPAGPGCHSAGGDALIDGVVIELRRGAVRSPAADRQALHDDEIHVWLVPLGEDKEPAAEFVSLLDREEAARAARFAHRRLRMHFVQSHAIVRRILVGYVGAVDASDLVFRRGRYGKPRLVAPAAACRLHFSLSHSGDRCILAVRLGQPLGIDIERLNDLPNALEIARRNFTAAETRMLADVHRVWRRDAFFALWTRKEAVSKALGASLATSLKQVEFELGMAGQPQLAALDGDRLRARDWVVLGIESAPGYVAALATAHPFRRLRHFVWREVPSACCTERRPVKSFA